MHELFLSAALTLSSADPGVASATAAAAATAQAPIVQQGAPVQGLTAIVVRGDAAVARSVLDPDVAEVIVQVEGDPVFPMRRGTAGSQEIFAARERLQRKVASIAAEVARIDNEARARSKLAARSLAEVVRHEYTQVFCGFQATVRREALATIERLPGVVRVWPDRPQRALLDQSVPLIRADRVWNELGFTGAGVRVAIVDTGVDYTHPDLGGCLGPSCKVIGGYDFSNADADPRDDHGHGTHVAGIVGADGVVRGVAPDCRLLAYKVLDAYGFGLSSTVIAGIERAVDPDANPATDDGADVINLSLGGFGDPNDPTAQAVDNAVAGGVVVAVAAGNDGPYYVTLGSPGVARKALTVGASDKFDQIASFSSRGPATVTFQIKPEVTAPGVSIVSTVPQGSCLLCDPSGYRALNGTSMATPHVAGAAALLLQQHPTWTPERVRDALMQRAVGLGLDVFTQGSGRIDVYAAATAEALASPANVSLGFDDPEQPVFSRVETLTLTNLSATPRTYALTITGSLPSGVDAYVDPPGLSLAPGASGSATLTVEVDNETTPNPPAEPWSYEAAVRIVGGGQTLRLPFAFVKSPSLQLTFDEEPWFVIVHDRADFFRYVNPPGLSEHLLVPDGLVDVNVFYPDGGTHVVREQLSVHASTSVAISKSDAVYPLTIVPSDRNDGPLTLTRGLRQSAFLPKAQNFIVTVTSGASNAPPPTQFRFSSLSEDYTFEVSLLQDTPPQDGPLYLFHGYARDGIDGPLTFQYPSGGFKHVVFRHTPRPGFTALRPVSFLHMRPDPPFLSLGFGNCSDADPPLVAPFDEEAYLDPIPYPGFIVGYLTKHAYGPSACYGGFMYETLMLAAESPTLLRGYRFYDATPLVETTSSAFPMAIGPYSWFGRFSNWQDRIFAASAIGVPYEFFLGATGARIPHGALPYELLQDGQTIQAGTIPFGAPIDLPVDPAGHELRIPFESFPMAGHWARSTVDVFFNTSYANPPTLTSFGLFTGTEHVERIPADGGSVRFKLSDDYGVEQIVLSYDPGGGFVRLPVVSTGPDQYAALIPPAPSAPAVVPMSLQVRDMEGNILTWSYCSPDFAKPEVCDGQDNDCDGIIPASELLDADGDGRAACAGDCNDADYGIWGTPTEVRELGGIHVPDPNGFYGFHWILPADGSLFGSTRYDVLRSTDPGNFVAAATCVVSGQQANTTVREDAVPPSGAAFFYLVRARNNCPAGIGPLGTRSDGTPRQGRSCP